MKRIVFDPVVRFDLQSAKRFLEEQQPGLGADFMIRVRNQFQYIASYPRAARIVEGDVRKISIEKFKFEIYYRVGDDEIFVMAVLHKRRHQDTWKKRLRKDR